MDSSMCEKCLKAPGTEHTFHYGKRAGLPDLEPPPVYYSATLGNMHSTWTEHYEVGGVDSVVLCDRCLARARVRRAVRTVLREWIGIPLIAVLYLFCATAVVVFAWQGNWTQTAIWLAVGVGATLIAYTVVYLMLESEDFAQQAAVEVHRDKLSSEGWDAFWTDREFLGLTPH